MKILRHEFKEYYEEVSFWKFTIENLFEGFLIGIRYTIIVFLIYWILAFIGIQAKFYVENEKTEKESVNFLFTLDTHYERTKK